MRHHFLSQRRLDLAKDARGGSDRETIRDGEEIVVRYLRPFAVNGQLMLSAVRRPWIVSGEISIPDFRNLRSYWNAYDSSREPLETIMPPRCPQSETMIWLTCLNSVMCRLPRRSPGTLTPPFLSETAFKQRIVDLRRRERHKPIGLAQGSAVGE